MCFGKSVTTLVVFAKYYMSCLHGRSWRLNYKLNASFSLTTSTLWTC